MRSLAVISHGAVMARIRDELIERQRLAYLTGTAEPPQPVVDELPPDLPPLNWSAIEHRAAAAHTTKTRRQKRIEAQQQRRAARNKAAGFRRYDL